MLPRFRPHLTARDLVGMASLRHSEETPPEALVDKQEREFAQATGYPHAVWFPYGRVAVRAFLETLGGRARDNGVVVSPFNCVALGNAIASAGWSPVYVDTEADGFNQDPDRFLEAFADSTTRAGIAVSLWGVPFESIPFQRVEKPLLFDFALRGLDPRPAPLRAGDGAIYSFNWGKPLSTFRGAMLCGLDTQTVTGWRAWRDSVLWQGGWLGDFTQALALKAAFSPWIFRAALFANRVRPPGKGQPEGASSKGWPLPREWARRPSVGVLKMGCDRLVDIPRLRAERATQVRRYFALLEGLELRGILLPPRVTWLSHFPVRSANAHALAEAFLRSGIFVSTELYDRLLSDYSWLRGKPRGPLTRATGLTKTTVHLPLYHGMGADQQERVCRVLRSFLEKENPKLTRKHRTADATTP